MQKNKIITFGSKIASWQRQFGRRDLPWTRVGWGYGVWISEVMLQQTQVCTVLPRFEKFITRFPTIKDLAAASLDDVLAQWSGLGYYTRAKNLHHAAQKIIQDHDGQFPQELPAVLNLPGIGQTTAGAILSLAFRKKYPILDGNVKRILKRCFKTYLSEEVKEYELWSLAEELLPQQTEIGDYNQGLMDLGALVCTFRSPKCTVCPLKEECDSFKNNTIDEKKCLKKVKSKRKNRLLTALVLLKNKKVFLERVPKDLKIWQDLYFFPVVLDVEMEVVRKNLGAHFGHSKIMAFKHLCTHISLKIETVIYEQVSEHQLSDLKKIFNLKGKWYSFEDFDEIGLSSPVLKVLKQTNFNTQEIST